VLHYEKFLKNDDKTILACGVEAMQEYSDQQLAAFKEKLKKEIDNIVNQPGNGQPFDDYYNGKIKGMIAIKNIIDNL
jgi:high-affinity K+ transport system ATPase subunit B